MQDDVTEVARPCGSNAQNVMKKNKRCGESGATGKWGTSNCICTGATIYNIKQPVVVMMRPARHGEVPAAGAETDELWDMT